MLGLILIFTTMDQLDLVSSQGEQLRQETQRFRRNGLVGDVQAVETYVKELEQRDIPAHALQTGQKAPDFTLNSGDGKKVTLSEELQRGPVILTWYRGGWCPYCNIQLDHLQKFLDRFKEAESSLIALSPELPRRNIATRERHQVAFEILTDTNNRVARQYGGVYVLNEEVKGYYGRMGALDYYYERNMNEFPVPATFIVDIDLTVRYAFVEADFRQRADPEQLLEAVIRLREEKKQGR